MVTETKDNLTLRAAKNLQYARGLPVEGFSVYEAIKYDKLVIEKKAFEKLLEKIG